MLSQGADPFIKNKNDQQPIDEFRSNYWNMNKNIEDAEEYDKKIQEWMIRLQYKNPSQKISPLLQLIINLDLTVAQLFHIQNYGVQFYYSSNTDHEGRTSSKQYSSIGYEGRYQQKVDERFQQLYELWKVQKEQLIVPQTFEKLITHFKKESKKDLLAKLEEMTPVYAS